MVVVVVTAHVQSLSGRRTLRLLQQVICLYSFPLRPSIALISRGERMQENLSTDRHYTLIDSLVSRGPDCLSDFELLTLVFGGCVPLAEAGQRAHEYCKEIGPPASMQSLDFSELTFFKGIGEAKAAAIVAGVELGRRSSKSARRDDTLPLALDAARKTSSTGLFI